MKKKIGGVLLGVAMIGMCVGAIVAFMSKKGAGQGLQETMQQPKDLRIEGPPDLLVTCGEEQIVALEGTYSWYYQNEDGTRTGVDADYMHALQRKESMPCLLLAALSDVKKDRMYARLQFEIMPDEVNVRCWSVDCWEDIDAESQAVELEAAEYSIPLLQEDYIYEVIAVWKRSESYGGDARYCFYTER